MSGWRGAVLGFALMQVASGGPVAASSAEDGSGHPPSGQTVDLLETLVEPQLYDGSVWLIVRVLAPGLGSGQVDDALAQADMDWACETWGLAAAAAQPEPPLRIVVQMMDQIVPRGETNMDATQYFAGYSIETGSCILELF